MTETVVSADGTAIAFDRAGTGEALVIVGGALNTRFSPGALVPLLADRFTVYSYDRRGRGDSGDTPPYAVEREVEDLAAVIRAAGGTANVYGHSSGGALALRTAAGGAGIRRLAVYESPFLAAPAGPDAMDGVQGALDAGDPARAVEIFIEGTGAGSAEGLRQAPFWPALVALASTLPYDLAIMGDGSVPVGLLSRVAVPTLAMDGGASPQWAAGSALAIVAAVSGARRTTVAGQGHGVEAEAVAPIIRDFFATA